MCLFIYVLFVLKHTQFAIIQVRLPISPSR